MALTRSTEWTAGDTLTAADLNAEFNNVLQNPISLISPTTGDINFGSNQALSFRVEVLSSDPASSTGNQGRIFFNTGSTTLKMDNGTAIITVAPEATASTAGVGQSGSWVRQLEGAMSTNLTTYTFRQCLLHTTDFSNSHLIASTASFSIDTRAVGPIVNGRDQASAFASKVVHLYAISTGAGSTTPAGIASTNPPPTGPTMPSTTGYDSWAYLGSVPYSTGSSGIVSTKNLAQRGAWSYYDSYVTVLSSGTATSATAVNLSTAVPTNATEFQIQIAHPGVESIGVTSFLLGSFNLRLASSQHITITGAGWTGGGGEAWRGSGTIASFPNLNTTPEVSYWSTVSAGTGYISLNILGYKVSNGDA